MISFHLYLHIDDQTNKAKQSQSQRKQNKQTDRQTTCVVRVGKYLSRWLGLQTERERQRDRQKERGNYFETKKVVVNLISGYIYFFMHFITEPPCVCFVMLYEEQLRGRGCGGPFTQNVTNGNTVPDWTFPEYIYKFKNWMQNDSSKV